MVFLTTIHIHVRAEIFGKLFLSIGAGEGDDFEAHFVGVLEREVAEAAEALDGD